MEYRTKSFRSMRPSDVVRRLVLVVVATLPLFLGTWCVDPNDVDVRRMDQLVEEGPTATASSAAGVVRRPTSFSAFFPPAISSAALRPSRRRVLSSRTEIRSVRTLNRSYLALFDSFTSAPPAAPPDTPPVTPLDSRSALAASPVSIPESRF